jgi:hypothetical protein
MANTDYRYRLIIHVPNEGNRGKWGHIWARRKGLQPGVPDVLCLVGAGPYRGFAIEFKSASGRTSPHQKDWMDRLTRAGFACVIRRSFEEAKDWTETYMALT